MHFGLFARLLIGVRHIYRHSPAQLAVSGFVAIALRGVAVGLQVFFDHSGRAEGLQVGVAVIGQGGPINGFFAALRGHPDGWVGRLKRPGPEVDVL